MALRHSALARYGRLQSTVKITPRWRKPSGGYFYTMYIVGSVKWFDGEILFSLASVFSGKHRVNEIVDNLAE